MSKFSTWKLAFNATLELQMEHSVVACHINVVDV
jgi:hypothetical protein